MKTISTAVARTAARIGRSRSVRLWTAEIAGVALLATAGALVTPALGLLVVGVFLIIVGNADDSEEG